MRVVRMHDHHRLKAGVSQLIEQLTVHSIGQHDGQPGVNPQPSQVINLIQSLDQDLEPLVGQR